MTVVFVVGDLSPPMDLVRRDTIGLFNISIHNDAPHAAGTAIGGVSPWVKLQKLSINTFNIQRFRQLTFSVASSIFEFDLYCFFFAVCATHQLEVDVSFMDREVNR